MGNEHSHQRGHSDQSSHGHSQSHRHKGRGSASSVSPEVKRIFDNLTGGEGALELSAFEEKLGELAKPLFEYLADGDESKTSLTLEQFSQHAQSLIGSSTDVFVKIFQPSSELLRLCFDSAKLEQPKEGDAFIKSLLEDMAKLNDTYESTVSWKHENCPGLCTSIQEKVYASFYNREHKTVEFKSDILTPSQMYLLHGMLPRTVYFPKNKEDAAEAGIFPWVCLYSSHNEGISINRFETRTFDYNGATVVVFRKSDGSVSAVCNDQAWKNSTRKFGGNNSVLVHFLPNFSRVDGAEMIYCNYKLRSSPFGITFGRFFSINDDMSNVHDLEVWGCADESVLNEQKTQKARHKRAAEQRGKVPLPGNWDENPDKSIMEMAGFQFSNERKPQGPEEK
uniref:TLDc domain-containing protein n=1 Tax=Panagrellus redivivus TaxID=6233 RepID=A0A7E4W5H6_PANRE